MASTDWGQAQVLQNAAPHTYTALEHLVMAMAEANKNQGKKSLFGVDKGLKAYRRFEEKLSDTLLALHLDGLVSRTAPAGEYRRQLAAALDVFSQAFPNWPDAYEFAYKILSDEERSNNLIGMLIGIRK